MIQLREDLESVCEMFGRIYTGVFQIREQKLAGQGGECQMGKLGGNVKWNASFVFSPAMPLLYIVANLLKKRKKKH